MGAIWNGIKAALGHSLAFFFDRVPDYGISIILLTVVVSLLLFPLTLKQTRSMRGMQLIQPEVKRLQKELKGDREELNKQLMAMYKERGVNPAAGCLPLIVQMPIWFALFQVLRISTFAVVGSLSAGSPAADAGLMAGDEIRAVDEVEVDSWKNFQDDFADGEPHELTVRRDGSDLVLTVRDLDGLESSGETVIRPDNVLPGDSSLEDALRDGKTNFLGMDLLFSPAEAAADGLTKAIPYILLIVLVMVTGYYQQWQTTRTRKDTPEPTQQQQGMQTAMKIMPLFLGFISWNFPTGLVLYFAASALFRIGQQAVILRIDDSDPDDQVDAPKPSSDGPTAPPASQSGPSPHASKKRKKRRRK